MFCFKCGFNLTPEYEFCPKCGTKIPPNYWETYREAAEKAAAAAPQAAPQAASQPPQYAQSFPNTVPQPKPEPQPVQEAKSVPQPEPTPEPMPEPAEAVQQSEPEPQPSADSGEPLVTCKVYYGIDAPGSSGFKFGGADEGYAIIYNDRFDLTKKSKLTAAAFGMIGSAIEGKGKPFRTLRKSDFAECNKIRDKKGRLSNYRCTMTDGSTFTMDLRGSEKDQAEKALDKIFGIIITTS
ncbi:MAG: zinc ribbon domain-containing protein [Mogibacterium sp.]|nr:zinc ribbon domain-containing protein [Mogibacterium sp.]